MRFDSLGKRLETPSKRRRGEANRRAPVLVCVDVQQGAPMDGMPLAELAEFTKGYDRVLWLLDRVQCEDATIPDAVMDAWGGEIPSNVKVVEKEYGGLLHFALEAGYGEEAIAFFREMVRKEPREQVESEHREFLEAMEGEMRDSPDKIWHRMEASSEELVTGIDSTLVLGLGPTVDLCGGAVGECLQEIEMMLETYGITAYIVTRFIY